MWSVTIQTLCVDVMQTRHVGTEQGNAQREREGGRERERESTWSACVVPPASVLSVCFCLFLCKTKNKVRKGKS